MDVGEQVEVQGAKGGAKRSNRLMPIRGDFLKYFSLNEACGLIKKELLGVGSTSDQTGS